MTKLKHIFIFIFFISVTALSFQGMVTYLLKEGNALKKQLCTSNIPVSEEEDETEKTKIEEDDLFSEENKLILETIAFVKIIWPENSNLTCSCSLPIFTPPPEI